MKSVNIFRKGCYDILMWWMDTFGIIIATITIVAGVGYTLAMMIALNILLKLREIKSRLQQDREKKIIEHKIRNFYERNNPIGDINCGVVNYNNPNCEKLDTNTLEETISYIETKT
jgi:hypothetical protein